jgi:hypothetical protein
MRVKTLLAAIAAGLALLTSGAAVPLHAVASAAFQPCPCDKPICRPGCIRL